MITSIAYSTMRGGARTRIGPAAASATTLTVLLDDLDAEDLAEPLEDEARARKTRTWASAASAARTAAIFSTSRSSKLSLSCGEISWIVSRFSSTAAMACPISWSDVDEILIERVDDEATVTAESEAEGGDKAIVTAESPVVYNDDIVDVVDYVIVAKLENSPPKDQLASKSQSGSLTCGRIRSSGSVRSCTFGSRRGKRVASRRVKRVA